MTVPVRARAFYHAEIGVSKVEYLYRLPNMIATQFSTFTIRIIALNQPET